MRVLACVFGLLCGAAGEAGAPAQSGPGLAASDVEAAYLYNFGKFVTWPSGSLSGSVPLAFCIVGDDSFVPTLSSMVANETLQGHKLVARRVASASAAEGCQIVFIGQSEDAHLPRELAALQKRPILTVSDIPTFLDRGGMIQFLVQNNRVRFAINLKAAEQTGLALSSQLLKLAVYVTSTQTPEAAR